MSPWPCELVRLVVFKNKSELEQLGKFFPYLHGYFTDKFFTNNIYEQVLNEQVLNKQDGTKMLVVINQV